VKCWEWLFTVQNAGIYTLYFIMQGCQSVVAKNAEITRFLSGQTELI